MWRSTTKMSWRRFTETLLGVSFETASNVVGMYIKTSLGRRYDVATTSHCRVSSKSEFLTTEGFLLEKAPLEKAATMKRFEYSPLGSELKNKITL